MTHATPPTSTVLEPQQTVSEVLERPLSQAIFFISPDSLEGHSLVDNFKRNLRRAGATVGVTADIWRFKLLFRKPRRGFLLLNWFEDQVLQNRDRPRWVMWLIFHFKLTAARVQGLKLIWIKHNHYPHQQDVSNQEVQRVHRLLEKVSWRSAVHSPQVAKQSAYFYIPLPLYDPQIENPQIEDPQTNLGSDSAISRSDKRVAILGSIRKNKQLEQILASWPVEVPLLLAGKPARGYDVKPLLKIIEQRKLNVTTVFRSLSEIEFDTYTYNATAILIPNADRTMIVSGVFYHAASCGTPIIMMDTAFGREMAELCYFAFVAKSPDEICGYLARAASLSKVGIRSEADRLFGQLAFEKHITELVS